MKLLIFISLFITGLLSPSTFATSVRETIRQDQQAKLIEDYKQDSLSFAINAEKIDTPEFTQSEFIVVIGLIGGGIKGLTNATMGAALEKSVGRPLYQLTNLISGISSGAILAAAMASEKTMDQTSQLFKQVGAQVFRKDSKRLLKGGSQLLTSKYSSTDLKNILKQALGEELMLSQVKTPVVLLSYDLKKDRPFFMRSDIVQKVKFMDIPLWKAAFFSALAPMYFTPEKYAFGEDINNGKTGLAEDFILTDGGIASNSPGMLGYIIARDLYPGKKIVVIELGAGTILEEANEALKTEGRGSGGMINLFGSVIGSLMSGPNKANTEISRNLVRQNGDVYIRLQPVIEKEYWDLDNASETHMAYYEQKGDQFISNSKFAKLVIDILKKKVQQRDNNKWAPLLTTTFLSNKPKRPEIPEGYRLPPIETKNSDSPPTSFKGKVIPVPPPLILR